MSLKINTNIAALNAHCNMIKNDSGLSKSLERLSSGLRINKAADDASGMAIADALKAQALGLGQAVSNANDAVSVIQTADGALEESINIVNTIRTKALQAASDGQSTDSRAAIQRDIDKLLGSLNNIADTTAFNGQTLLKGDFQNKFFQVGAYANQTISVSISNADASHVGRLATVSSSATSTTEMAKLAPADVTATSAGNFAQLVAATSTTTGFKVNGVDMAGNLSGQEGDQLSAKGIAAAINEATTTNVTATAVTEFTGTGTTGVVGATVSAGDIKINGVDIGAVTVVDKDSNGNLATAINDKALDTGVTAAVDSSGVLTLTAADGGNIQLSGNSLTALGAGFADNSTAIVVVAGTAAAESATSNFYLDGVNISWDASGVAAADDTALLASLNAAVTAGTVDSNYAFTSDAGGNVTITRTDGQDVNIAVGTAALAAAQTVDTISGAINFNTVQNDAHHGQVSLVSNSTINITGDATTLQSLGLGDGTVTSSVSTLSGGIADADVTSFSAAQITVQRSDSALTSLDTIRSQLGSAQNQVESTIRNITVTQVNVTSAESNIRDVDFAAESANFAKFQVLAQSGSFAMAQANASLENVLRLLQ